MFYVLFTYSKGQKEKDFLRFRSEDDVIEFLHKHYEKIDIVQIIVAEKSYKLGLIETDEFIKSELVLDDVDPEPFPETEEKSLTPVADRILKGEKVSIGLSAGIDISEKDIEESKEILAKKEDAGEKSAMEKIGDEIEKEMTDEELERKNEALLKKADEQIAAAKDLKLTWSTCPVCKERKMAPWNKTGKCSYCQTYKKKLRKKEEKI